jgi:methylmalonyl-CoA mutase N-terminal domain/subunit
LDDAKTVFRFRFGALAATSVGMTINGPAPMLLGFFMNAAIDQQCECNQSKLERKKLRLNQQNIQK